MITNTRIIYKLSVAILILFSGCKTQTASWNELPQVISLKDLKQTEFVATLEDSISNNKNSVYAAALLYAWGKVKKELKDSIVPGDHNSSEFKLLVSSNSHQNSLRDAEYTATVNVADDGLITAHAIFNKTLPFESKMQKMDQPVLFNNTQITAFGMHQYDKDVVRSSQVLYYKNDDQFILKLLPKDMQHDIILAKGLSGVVSLGQAVKGVNGLISKGEVEKSQPQDQWKYDIFPEDMFAIPVISFNIETFYQELQNQVFKTTNGVPHTLIGTYQRTALKLNEYGAVVESEAVVATDSSGPIEIEHPPKKMVFDKPFYIIIKRIDSRNPYFVMKVENTELLTKK